MRRLRNKRSQIDSPFVRVNERLAPLMKGKFAKLETKMRAILVSHELFTPDNLPNRRYVAVTAPSPAAGTAPSPDRTVRTVCALDSSDQTMAWTDKAVFNRLRIKGVGEEVMALVDTDAEEQIFPHRRRDTF